MSSEPETTATIERWRSVPGYEGAYLVSDSGRVRSLLSNRLLKPDEPSGYPRVTLSRNGAIERRFVHRLVLEAFVGPCPRGMEGCHGNGARSDARLTNLRWDTKSANQADRLKHGTACIGDAHANTKVSDAAANLIRETYTPRCRTNGAKAIAKRLGVHPVTVEKIARGITRKAAI